MTRHSFTVSILLTMALANVAVAQVSVSDAPIHPLTGYPAAEHRSVPQSRSVGAPIQSTSWTNGALTTSLTAGCSTDVCVPPCGESECGEYDCGEGCGAGDCCGSSCLFDTPLLSCFRNRKSCFSDDMTYSVGGALRHRYMDEENRLRPGVPAGGARTQYNLWRFNPYVSMTWNDTLSGYVEGIDASAFGYDAPLFPVGIDVNRSDLLRFYAELNLGDIGEGNLRYRYGRQFLKYGSQHLLSPLAWANTYRNFEGHKFVWTSGDWSVDAFSMASVNAAAGGSGFSPTAADHVDSDRRVHGVYSSYSGLENRTVDMYWIWSDENNPLATAHDGNRHTFGGRLAGKQPVKECDKVVGAWNWDIEGALQVGEDTFTSVAPGGVNQDVFAGFFSAIGGYTFSDTPWTPSISGIFYWGSGDDNPNDGEINTIYTLYPLGHAYWGLIDNFSGQNLIDYGLQATVKPHEKLTLLAAYHWFDRATGNDAVYNIVGAPFATANGGTDIGNELDLVATWNATEAVSVQAGYFWFWYGSAISSSPQARPDASQFYLQTTLTF